MTIHRHLFLGGALVACALGASSAQGAITPTLVALTPNSDGTFTFVYDVDLAEDQHALSTGASPTGGTTPTGTGQTTDTFQDYFTLYDFAGLVGGSQVQPEGWTAGASLVGPTPSTTNPSDDPNMFNVFWYRTGPWIFGPADLGTFSVRSIYGVVALDNYTSDATRSQGPTAGTAVASIGTANVPQVTGGCPFAGPCNFGPITEPGTAVMLVIGLLGTGLYYRRTP